MRKLTRPVIRFAAGFEREDIAVRAALDPVGVRTGRVGLIAGTAGWL
ncbi:hypothetical protein FHS82_000441 [Pseudochelatococcus lubricantis]|uniref:Uncharacterized protein n=1 Tax=Pseudochelatococcus lubricantis TaxID=1538102 RepID=A0ABX0UUI6_9HYPH|nr:hypothetical protein [Pseudochelatococcus lubricantis]NIJ56628.1 hypothetical protein [Pseudochelatococcus lubricantis]